MFELFTEQLEIHKRKQPIKTSDRFDFLGVVIIAMFNVFTKHNSLKESKVVDVLFKLKLIKINDINNLKILDILYQDGLIDYYSSNRNIKLTNKGKEFNKYLKNITLFVELQDKLRELL